MLLVDKKQKLAQQNFSQDISPTTLMGLGVCHKEAVVKIVELYSRKLTLLQIISTLGILSGFVAMLGVPYYKLFLSVMGVGFIFLIWSDAFFARMTGLSKEAREFFDTSLRAGPHAKYQTLLTETQSDCIEMKALLDKSPALKALFHDIAQHRELMVWDLHVAKIFAAREQAEQMRAQNKAAREAAAQALKDTLS